MVQTVTQLYFILTSISVVFTGMNCILFFFCVYVLWGQKSKSRRLLLFSSTVQFCLYFEQLSVYALPSCIIYIVNSAIEGFLLIWRIYVLYNYNITICIPSGILLALQIAFSGTTAKGAATQQVDVNNIYAFSLISWSLIAAVNVSASVLICLRLWIVHQRAESVLSVSKYKSTILVVVECGALVTIVTVVMLILHAVKDHMGMAGLGITTQVATMAPLLIIARYGILSRQNDLRKPTPQIPLRISVVRTEDTRVDTAVEFTRGNRCIVSDPLPVSPGVNHSRPFCDA